LNLLNEQNVWGSLLLATDDEVSARKRFLTRSARYGGLLNILEFQQADMLNDTSVSSLLTNANSWIAFNVPQSSVPKLADLALAHNIQRAIFTVELPPSRINDTQLPEFSYAINAFQQKDASFTGIRHGLVIPGDEDRPYEMVNSSIPLIEDQVAVGVLGRVVAELLRIPAATNTECGLSASSSFAGAYLNILRQSGLTRSQEVQKIFSGGVQRVAQLTLRQYKAKEQKAEEAKQLALKRKEEESLQLEKDLLIADKQLGSQAVDMDEESEEEEETDELRIKIRSQEILASVWREYDTRMYTKSTSKLEFFDTNKEKALALATKEIQEENEARRLKAIEKDEELRVASAVLDVPRMQYGKLLVLERKEMQNQKDISDCWVRFIYLLLETTMQHCKDESILFSNLDEFQQTLLLRKKANELRKMANLLPFDVIYDPLDASAVVAFVASQKDQEESMFTRFGLDRPADEIHAELERKYGEALKSVAALRGANQIIALAIETLKKELPPIPPSVSQIRRNESLSKQQLVSAARLEATRNRGKPFSEGTGSVGTL